MTVTLAWRRSCFAEASVATSMAMAPALAQTTLRPRPAARPAPYSLPWLLRPAVPGSVVRLDETMAFYEDPASGTSGSSYLTSLIATWKASQHWVPIFREIWVGNDAPREARTPRAAASRTRSWASTTCVRSSGLALLRVLRQHHPDRQRRRRHAGRGGGGGHDRRDLGALGHGQRALRRRTTGR